MEKNIFQTRVLISGRVQAVFFRVWTKKQAEKLSIKGWVKNTPDNKVEALFQGPKDKIDKMIELCHSGPPLAKVKDIKVNYEESNNIYQDFKIIN